MRVREGHVELEVPEQSEDGVGDSVFYNPRMELNRDLTIATLRAYRESARDTPPVSSYLDAMAASGIRGARAASAGFEVTLSDVDSDALERCRETLERNALEGECCHRNANSLLQERERYFDVVDLDPYGTPMPFADAAFSNTADLVCVTATDTAPLCGAHFESGKRKYSCVPRNTEYHAEMGLRVLLSALARTASRYDVAITPILSHVSDHYVRTYLDIERGASVANDALEELGFVYHCPECLSRELDSGLVSDPPERCSACGGTELLPAGPVWLGATHDRGFVGDVREQVTNEMGTAKRARSVLSTLESELHEPMHYDQHKLSKRWNATAIAMDDFLEGLREAGVDASRTHYGGTTLKTTASVEQMREITVESE